MHEREHILWAIDIMTMILTTPVQTLQAGDLVLICSNALLAFPTAAIGRQAGRDTAAPAGDVVLEAVQELAVAREEVIVVTQYCVCI